MSKEAFDAESSVQLLMLGILRAVVHGDHFPGLLRTFFLAAR